MSGSRFHPYALDEGTNSEMSWKPSRRSASATETSSHQATSSQKLVSHSTTLKTNRLLNGKPKKFPSNKAETTASPQEDVTCLSASQAVSPPLSSSKATSAPVASKTVKSTPVASKPVKSTAVASKPVKSTAVASQPVKSTMVASQPVKSTAISLQPVKSTAVASQPVKSIAVSLQKAKSTPVALQPVKSTPVSLQPAKSTQVALQPVKSTPVASKPGLRLGTSTRPVSSTPLAQSIRPAASTSLPAESMVSGLAAYPYWSMAQNLYAMEQQQRIQLQQQWRHQLWMQQPNIVSMASSNHEYLRSVSQEYLRGTSQEYLRYMNELRHMSVLPLIPTSPAQLPYLSPMQDQPLNLSLKDNVKDSTPSSSSYSSNKPNGSIDCFTPESTKSSKEPSPKTSSPPLLKLHPTKPIQEGSLDPEVAKMFPHLRTTDMGSIVLWNFLWALLADNSYKGIIRWVDRPSLKFQVVHPLALAKLWGTVKKNKTMNWQKLLKVINLYLSKNILKQGEDKLLFQFILVPESTEVKAEKDSSA